jgi:hypothetical protein
VRTEYLPGVARRCERIVLSWEEGRELDPAAKAESPRAAPTTSLRLTGWQRRRSLRLHPAFVAPVPGDRSTMATDWTGLMASNGRHRMSDGESGIKADSPRGSLPGEGSALTSGGGALLVDQLVRSGLGDDAAFGHLYLATAGQVFGWATRLSEGTADAEALARDCYREIWRQAPRFDAATSRVLPWLAAIVVRQHLDLRKSPSSRPRPVG